MLDVLPPQDRREFDTLGDLPGIDASETLEHVCDHLIAPVFTDPSSCLDNPFPIQGREPKPIPKVATAVHEVPWDPPAGLVFAGKRTLSFGHASVDAPDPYWGTGVVVGDEMIFVRSSPKGRIGMPLQYGERRKVSVMVVDLQDPGGCNVAQVRHAILQLSHVLPNPANSPATAAFTGSMDYMRARAFDMNCERVSNGTLGVNFLPIRIWDGRIITALAGDDACVEAAECNGDGRRTELPKNANKAIPYSVDGFPVLPGAFSVDQIGGNEPCTAQMFNQALSKGEDLRSLSRKTLRNSGIAEPGSHWCVLACDLLQLPLSILSTNINQLTSGVEWSSRTLRTANAVAVRDAFREELAKQRAAQLRVATHAAHATRASAGSAQGTEQQDAKAMLDELRTSKREQRAREIDDSRIDHAMSTAHEVAEMASMHGLLDMLADPFFEGTLADDLYAPWGFPMLMIMATRVARGPERYCFGLCAHVPGDQVAGQTLASILESACPCLAPYDGQWAIDVVLSKASALVGDKIAAFEKLGDATGNQMSVALTDFIQTLYRFGTAMAVDLVGNGNASFPTTKTHFGVANEFANPLFEHQAREARAFGMGRRGSHPELPYRNSSRSQRLQTLIRCMVEVDAWIRSGDFRGKQLRPSAGSPQHDYYAEFLAHKFANLQSPTGKSSVPSAPSARKQTEPGKARSSSKRAAKNAASASAAQTGVGAALHQCSSTFATVFDDCKMSQSFEMAVAEVDRWLSHGAFHVNTYSPDLSVFAVCGTRGLVCASCQTVVPQVHSLLLGGHKRRFCAACHAPLCLLCIQKLANSGELSCNVCTARKIHQTATEAQTVSAGTQKAHKRRNRTER